MKTDKKTNASVLSGAGLAILGTTCCALPILLISIGAGSAMASLVSIFPWIAPLSKYKLVIFSFTFLVQAYAWWQVLRVSQCSIADAHRLRWQKRILWVSTSLLILSAFAAYLAVPLLRWIEK